MCGIIGVIGTRPAAARLIEGLRRLEYRGYDSAGIATVEDGTILRRRAEGRIANLEAKLAGEPLPGVTGIGHTRWATHGKPSERNAHPHLSDGVAIVHNGIIENFQALRREIVEAGRTLSSDTDTEVVAHLIAMARERGRDPVSAFSETLGRLQGAFALAVLIGDDENLLLAARRGSPLAIGRGEGEMFLGSDAIALAPFTNRITYLEEGDWAVLGRGGAALFDERNRPAARPETVLSGAAALIDKGNHRHFMEKEIHEQPEAISHTLSHYIDFATGRALAGQAAALDFANCSRLTVSACGTAYYAGLVGKYWFERLARLPVDIDVASEFRYREAPLPPNGAALFVSQSGETADTLASLRYCRQQGQRVAAVVNVATSTMAREADLVLPTLAGPEIGVASTKAFTAQLSALMMIAVIAGRARGVLSPSDEEKLVAGLAEVPRHVRTALRLESEIAEIAKEFAKVDDVLFLGRGTSFPIALEGALKLKEISYIHAEGYAAGELKHGPIALIDETMPVVVIAPYDRVFDKTVSNMQEVAARGGRIVLFTDAEGAAHAGVETLRTVVLPSVPASVAPIVFSVPVQLLAYHTAVVMGTDVDQPRNLAKSVTVE